MNQGMINTVHGIASYAKEKKIAHLATEDEQLTQNLITLEGRRVVNFGSCSYLGLEFDERLINAAKKAVENYGTQFSASRAYLSPKYYEELESKLSMIFQAPTIVTPTTTLGHMAAIPVLVGANDAVILDHQVHNSVQTAVQLLKASNIHVELVRHNRMDLLEKKIQDLRANHDKVWYMADGIYSMFGDAAPMDDIYDLLDKYPEFHFYVDDAHGMSCFGPNGRGFVLADRTIHEQMVMATSFAKAFATGGGALVFPNQELAQKVRNCGGPLITSGPMQPSALGAAVASADIHLSDDIEEFKEDLQQNILYTNLMLKKKGLLNLASDFSPIYFIPVGTPKVGYNLIHRMKDAGHFMNIGIFPAVPIKNTGVRFTITRLHTFEQIEKMVDDLAYHYPLALEEEDFSLEQVCKAFKIKLNQTSEKVKNILDESNLRIQNCSSITEIDKTEWNQFFDGQGTYDWDGLLLLEKSFSGNKRDEHNWVFDYILIRDNEGKVVLATFLTTSWAKDDMLSPAEVSADVELRRIENPMLMTSKTLSIGSSLTEGNHLYVDRNSRYWKGAMSILFKRISQLQEKYNAETIMLRDFSLDNQVMDQLMIDHGFFKIELPANMKIKDLSWENEEEFFSTLSKNNKRHFRKNISRNTNEIEYRTVLNPNEELIDRCYDLYLNVKRKSLELNTFDVPYEFFRRACESENWELICIHLKDHVHQEPVSMALCHKSNSKYTFLLAGNDYEYSYKFGSYRHLLYAITKRAKEINTKEIVMGYTSEIEKQRFGARKDQSCAYLQVKDHYNMQELGNMNKSKLNEYVDALDERRIQPIQ